MHEENKLSTELTAQQSEIESAMLGVELPDRRPKSGSKQTTTIGLACGRSNFRRFDRGLFDLAIERSRRRRGLRRRIESVSRRGNKSRASR